MVNELAVRRVSSGLATGSTHTGSYCKARWRLPKDIVVELTRCTGKLLDSKSEPDWHWRGRAVKLVDGTTVTMPDTEANQSVYPQQREQKPGLGFPICRIVGVISLARPAISEKRLSLTPGGKVCYELKTPYRDGSTHVAVLTLEPYGFMKYSLSSRCSLWSRASLRSTA